jgi:hypothetical protein
MIEDLQKLMFCREDRPHKNTDSKVLLKFECTLEYNSYSREVNVRVFDFSLFTLTAISKDNKIYEFFLNTNLKQTKIMDECWLVHFQNSKLRIFDECDFPSYEDVKSIDYENTLLNNFRENFHFLLNDGDISHIYAYGFQVVIVFDHAFVY